MSSIGAKTETRSAAVVASAASGPQWRRRARPAAGVVLLIVLLVLPLYVSQFWEQVGLLAGAAAIGAIGLNLLTGMAGQMSLAHPFFLGVGAYSYCYFAGSARAGSSASGAALAGLDLPPLAAIVLAILLAGSAGLVFSPIARRLRGISLGVASFALIFIGQHVLENATSITGGTFGRAVPSFSLPGFSFTDANPPLTVLDVPFGRFERLWYLYLLLFVASYLFARNLRRSRPGRALQAIRDSEVAASVMGVNVQRYKMGAFVLSSMYAGLAGVLIGLSFQQVIPDYFSFTLAVTYVAMIVIGGLGSVLGAVVGAVFVTALPLILQQYSGDLSFLAQPGSSGVSAADFADFVYGAAVIAVVVFAPDGLAALGFRRTKRGTRRGVTGTSAPALPNVAETRHP